MRPLYEVCKYEMEHALVEPVPVDYFGCRDENSPLQELIIKIRDSEVENAYNRTQKNIMTSLSVQVIRENINFQNAIIQGSNRDEILNYIHKQFQTEDKTKC